MALYRIACELLPPATISLLMGAVDRLLEQHDRVEIYILDAYVNKYIGPKEPTN